MSNPADRDTCPVCARSAPAGRHPCRFDCACRHGIPCNPPGAPAPGAKRAEPKR